ncbi:MAG: DUF362 domain-containing protein [Bacteroidetes bacterium]|nr:DUF362 domain-containing protein [Bacteroidota bacterium]
MSSIPDRPIAVIYKTRETRSLQEMATTLLETVSLKDRLPTDKKALLALKPNLVVSRPADDGATTHPEICEGIIVYLQSYGYKNIIIVEGSWVGDNTTKAYRDCGYEKLAEKAGITLINTQEDGFFTVDADGYALKVCNIMHKIDFLINIPVLKGHCQTYYTGALKNLKGCIPDSEKRRFHSLGLNEPIAKLNTVIKQDFIVMDGICGDPTFEEGGSPSSLNRIICSADPVLIDSYAATFIGLNYSDIPYISRSAELGVGLLWEGNQNQILELNTPEQKHTVSRDKVLEGLAKRVDEQEACSSCYAALIGALRSVEDLGSAGFAIGRAFRGTSSSQKFISSCIGIGTCTAGFTHSVPGCPPTSEVIAQIISELT